MKSQGPSNRPRPAGVPLSPAQLTARRAAWRRRRARRRYGLIAGLVAGLVLFGGFVVSGQSSRRPARSDPTNARSAGKPAVTTPAAHRPPSPARAARTEALAVRRVLRHTSYVRLLTHRRRELALTFDDGPSDYTPAILRILRRMHASATFFTIGRSVAIYPHLVAEEAHDGFDVGDHTEYHLPLGLLPAPEQVAELADAAAAIHRAGAPYPSLFRPPYGSFNATTLEILRAQRLLMVLWSVDTSDYIRPGVAKIIYTAVSGAQPGAIILMHDGGGDRSETVAALPRIVQLLRKRGYRLVTIAKLIADDPPPAKQPPPQPLSGNI